MTKDEAIKAMLQGEKVSHRFFGKDEAMMLLDPVKNIYLFEDGVKIDAQSFWSIRMDEDWLEDWEIVK